ncbi:DUF7351 domain-containing protein [Halorussus salinisoli]|uniref:DUF7351 domain-containing protein n=1 Tax=Halorussus salinisoli TaxID=2558242 RepID=UPI0010C1AEAA|nr:ArsR family transcriptional regulator [Halorussus salinisoli]
MSSDTERRSGLSPDETFAILGHETRLAILSELWDLDDPLDDPDSTFERKALSFADLRKRVGMRDGSQFNYHLTQLVGPFVRQTDEGYALRRAGWQIISTILAGTLTDEVVFDAEPIDDPCPRCGGQVVLDHGTNRSPEGLLIRCTACEGNYDFPEIPSGVLMRIGMLPPAGVSARSVTEMYRKLLTWKKHRLLMRIEGVCPECSGEIAVIPLICEDHVVGDGQVCPNCDRTVEIQFKSVCSVCKGAWQLSTGVHMLQHPTVTAFYHDHGYDPWGHKWPRLATETIADQTVVSEDPLTIEATVVIDDDQLAVTLDEEGTVVDVQT